MYIDNLLKMQDYFAVLPMAKPIELEFRNEPYPSLYEKKIKIKLNKITMSALPIVLEVGGEGQ